MVTSTSSCESYIGLWQGNALAHIDPAIAEEHRLKGNELFKEGAYHPPLGRS
jgi:hypothetical protein